MKRRAQAKIHLIIRSMSREEELAYWNRPPETPFEIWWSRLRRTASVRKTLRRTRR